MTRRWMFWRRTSSSIGSAAHLRDRLIAVGDTLRNQRQWRQAAVAYREALAEDPGHAAIWVQLGHALKESGDLAGGEEAYRHALTLEPRSADGWVQLGHTLKLQGRRDEAIAAYAAALRVDPGFASALAELIGLGTGPIAGAARGHGQADLHDLLRLTRDMRAMLDKVERMLPDIASLASIAIGQYALFRTLYRVPPAPPTVRARRWGAVIVASGGQIAASLAGVAHQTIAPSHVWLAGASCEARDLAARHGNYGVTGAVSAWDTGSSTPQDIDWLVVVADGAVLDARALEWFDWAADNCAASAIYPDEDWATSAAADPVPNFKPAYDKLADPGLVNHAVVATRRENVAMVDGIGIAGLIAHASARGGVGHLARVLATRPGAPPQPPAPASVRIDPSVSGRIAIIIPTRDGAMTLRPCIEALRRLAARPDDLEFVLLDNQSTEPETLSYLAELAKTAAARVIRADAAFNWSALNNAGAAETDDRYFLFINDDVEMQTERWDDILRTDLAMPGVGVVGARLSYPDGGLQHAGLVFGPSGRCEHEGVGTQRVPAQIAARWRMRRQVGAVTGAFLACSRQTFAEFDGFDVGMPIWFGDIDFCMRVRAGGYSVLFEPGLRGIHYESRSLAANAGHPARRAIWEESLAIMRDRWGAELTSDPWFNPHFSRIGRPFEALTEPSLTVVLGQLVRSVTVSMSPRPVDGL